MKIAEFTDSFIPIVDGVGRVVENYATHLADKGHECYVMAPMTNSGYRGGLKYELVDFHSLRVVGQPYKLGLPLMDTHFLMRMNDIKLDIVHAHSPFTAGQMAYNYANKRKIPLVGTFHSKYKDDFRQAMKLEMLAEVGTRMVVDFYDRCDEVWAVSESSAETLHRYGYKKRIVVMPNGADDQPIDSSNKIMAAEKYSLGGETTFLFVGQQNWKKNIERILLASEVLNKKGLPFKLVLTGQGPHSDEIKQKARRLGLENKMVYTGHISDSELLSGIYQCADLFVFPSLYDTSALVIREAAVNGTPSVAIKNSGAGETITDGENGYLCEDTTESLANIMEYAISNHYALELMGMEAKRTIPINWDNLMDDVLERYTELVDRRAIRKLGYIALSLKK